MNNWTELHIAVVYFSGLFIAAISGFLVFIYLQPLGEVIRTIAKKFTSIWSNSLFITLVLAGMLGGMSVSFTDCEGKYDYLKRSPIDTLLKGFCQISATFHYLAITLGFWLLFFIILRVKSHKH